MASEYVPVALTREVRTRALNRCEYCQTPAAYAPEPFEMEHIELRSAGGATASDNLALACGGCNGYKGARTFATDEETRQTVALFHPRRDVWAAHFAWSSDGQALRGLTPTGRVTIQVLQLNRAALQNLRWLLSTQNLHPPNED